MKTSLLIVVFLLIGYTGFSQEADSSKLWSLKECVDYALRNNIQVKRGELNVQSSQVTLTQAWMNLLPNANATGSYGYNWGRGLDPVTNQFISSQRNTVGSVNATGSVTLFNGFRIQNNLKQSSTDYKASEQDLIKARNDVSLNVVNLFVNVIFNKELVENAKLQLTSSQQQLERTSKQVAAGSLPRAEELNLGAQVATNEVNLINQTNALSISILQLKQAMQMPASESFDVEIPEIDPEDLLLEQSRDQVFSIARGIMPEIKSSELKVESSDYAVRAARGNLFPRISLNGSLNTNYSKASELRYVEDGGIAEYPTGYFVEGTTTQIIGYRPTGTFQEIYGFDKQAKDNLYKSVGLSMTIPIFNNYSNRASVQRARITNEQAKLNAREIDMTLRQNIETAFNDAVAASKSYESSLKQVQARDEAFRMTKQRYDIGAVNYVDYQVAENNLFQARTDLARAKYNFIFRKKLLDFYQGKSIILD